MKSLLLLCCFLASATLSAQDFDYSFKENFKISTPAQLKISSSDGNIEVLPGSGADIEVFFIAKQNNRLLEISRAELEEELTLTIIKTGSSLDIEVKYPTNNWSIDWRDRINVDFKIFTPRETSTELRTSDGNISLAGLISGQSLKTSDGNIQVSDIQGDVSAITSDGNIKSNDIRGKLYVKTSDGNISVDKITGSVESTTSDGDIRAYNVNGSVNSRTSDGNIDLANVRGDHSAHTSDGDIYFRDLYGSLEAVASDGNITGNVVELKGKLRARTSDGNIDISVPDQLGMNLYVKGESLDVPLRNFSGKSSKDLIDGQTNGGGVEVNLTTSDGNIRLDYR